MEILSYCSNKSTSCLLVHFYKKLYLHLDTFVHFLSELICKVACAEMLKSHFSYVFKYFSQNQNLIDQRNFLTEGLLCNWLTLSLNRTL